MVDFPLPSPRRRWRPGWLAAALAAGALGLAGMLLLSPEHGRVEVGTAFRGEFQRTVKGVGVLRAAESTLVVASVSGRVVRVAHLAGEWVGSGEPLVVSENPQLVQERVEAEARLAEAIHEAEALSATLAAQLLQAQGARVEAESRAKQAVAEREAKEALAKEGLLSSLELAAVRAAADAQAALLEVAKKREEAISFQVKASSAAQRARVEAARARALRAVEACNALTLRSPRDGLLEDLVVQPGAWVEAGEVVGRVSDVESLEAVVEVPQDEARGLRAGNEVRLYAGGLELKGEVRGLGAAAKQGMVQVFVKRLGSWPRDLRPGSTVEAEIFAEKKRGVLLVPRPDTYRGPGEGFVYVVAGSKAVRRRVVFGGAAGDVVEVISGLSEGDRVVVAHPPWEGEEHELP